MRLSFGDRVAGFILAALLAACTPAKPATPNSAPIVPPAVGVVQAARHPITESYEFMGRVQATDRVALVARVNAFLEKQLFTEGAEVKKGDLLYLIEQPPYQADLAAKQAAVAQAEALLQNGTIQFEREKTLLNGPAGLRAKYDDTLTAQRSAAAQLTAAQAAERQSQINLGYTEIRAPIDGRISRTSVTIGNVVGPSSGTLATIVSQDPMHITFPVPVRTAVDFRNHFAAKSGFNAVAIKIRLPDGRTYEQAGTLDFADVTISQDTDSLVLRGTIPNPVVSNSELGGARLRELVDGEFVTVVVESATPVAELTLPREAVLSDQRGEFVYVVSAGDTVERREVQLGKSTSATAVISSGLSEGERVVVDGIQRVQPGTKVTPGPVDTHDREADASSVSRN